MWVSRQSVTVHQFQPQFRRSEENSFSTRTSTRQVKEIELQKLEKINRLKNHMDELKKREMERQIVVIEARTEKCLENASSKRSKAPCSTILSSDNNVKVFFFY
ncbi:hypothetical protein HHI36_015853 [Cryptolaemus montrouzieri]|uniref:Uncharacterized protein n=1 Tax=Cryptolaemus montrouzieri TaxID=559131 RepID=A0ABD2N6U2_9CUCU